VRGRFIVSCYVIREFLFGGGEWTNRCWVISRPASIIKVFVLTCFVYSSECFRDRFVKLSCVLRITIFLSLRGQQRCDPRSNPIGVIEITRVFVLTVRKTWCSFIEIYFSAFSSELVGILCRSRCRRLSTHSLIVRFPWMFGYFWLCAIPLIIFSLGRIQRCVERK